MSKRSKKTPIISCKKCHGKGKLEISQPLADVYFAIESCQGIDAPAINEVLKLTANGGSSTAVNQRLNQLIELNLIERTKVGTAFCYFLKK